MTPTGFGPNLMQILSKKFNFTWSFYYPAKSEYGILHADGSYDGIKGEVSK